MRTPAGQIAVQASQSRQLSSWRTKSGVSGRKPSVAARAIAIRPRGDSSSSSVSWYVGQTERHSPQRMQRSMFSYSAPRRPFPAPPAWGKAAPTPQLSSRRTPQCWGESVVPLTLLTSVSLCAACP